MTWLREAMPLNGISFSIGAEGRDHGPINSWVQQPYLKELRDATPRFFPLRLTIAFNLIFSNYGADQGVDNDDESADGFNKMDYGGHDNFFKTI
jgi:hypothetical protein